MATNPYQRISLDDVDPPVKETQIDNSTFVDHYRDNELEGTSDKDSLLEKNPPSSPCIAERGDAGLRWSTAASPTDPRGFNLKFVLYLLLILVSFAGLIGVIAAHTYSGSSTYHSPGVKKITMDHVFNGTFVPASKGLRWVPEAGDGVYAIQDGRSIQLVDLKENSTSSLVATSDIKDEHGQPLIWYQWQLSPDMSYLLLKADPRKQWRWSSFGNYYVHNIRTKTTHPIIPPTNPSKTAYATWSPTGSAIAYVIENDLYVLPDASPNTKPIRVTTSGNASIFHGVPDWVYEEEIFSGDHALWWSPDSQQIAFLAFDETLVPEYTFPIYNPTDDSNAVIPYTTDVIMKYPKPGYNNPLVTAHVFDLGLYLAEDQSTAAEFGRTTFNLDWEQRKSTTDSIISEVAWVGNATLLMKEVNRNADDGNVILFNLDATKSGTYGRVVRKLGKAGEEGDDGWIDAEQTVYPLPETLSTAGTAAYLDIVPSPEGYNHIALFSPANSDSPRFLTSGNWEVTGGIKGINTQNGVVYFEAANPSSIQRHIFSVPIPIISSSETVEPTIITDTSKEAWHTSVFSPQAGFYVLSYHGPGVPWQKVIKTNDISFDLVLTNNEHLQNITREYEAPIVTHSVFVNDGYEFNVKEIRSPRMDDSGKTKLAAIIWSGLLVYSSHCHMTSGHRTRQYGSSMVYPVCFRVAQF